MSRPESYDGRHPVDAFSLVAGLLAVGVALVSLLDLDLDLRPAVVWPVLLVVAGAAGLVAAVRGSRGSGDRPTSGG